MSRCFPFPPPGCEKKAQPDDSDLLRQENRREKKHKKEKREDKEKKEKDRNGKHKEKKEHKENCLDKKEKHGDKKKDKENERDKDKEKSRFFEEKNVTEQSEVYAGEKLHRKEERDKDKSNSSDGKKPAGQFQCQSGEKSIQNSPPAVQIEDSKFVQELARRIRNEQKGTESQLVDRFRYTQQRKDESDGFAVMDAGTRTEGRGKNKDKRVDRKMDGQGIRDETRFSGNGMIQNKVEGMPRSMEKDIERMEGKGKSKERVDDKRGDKCKDENLEKKSRGKDKDREKEKRKEEKAKGKSAYTKTDVIKNDLRVLHNKTSHPLKDCDKNAVAAEGNIMKRKAVEMNGFLHDNEAGPSKMRRPSSNSLTENGRKSEPCQTPGLFSSDRQGAANNFKVDSKERRVNGIIEAQPLSVSAMKPPSAVTHIDHIAAASRKRPHSDSKYLSKVLSVPKMEEWSDFDDQEWLFSSKDPPSRKAEVGSAGVELRVWDDALQIESADIFALPYVIPY